MTKQAQLEQAIANLEAQRAILGAATVDAAIAALNAQLTALEPTPETKRQRKQVTVLFADVSGFTAMSEAMDAEDVQETMNALWQRVDQAILNHNGRIDKHIGDAVMALWGVNEARENDPKQAIRAALSMQTAVAKFCEEANVTLRLRIGLNTGLVLLGEIGTTAEFTAMGDTVNIASRLEHAAPIGSILISHDTYRHIRGVFDVQAQPLLTVKGKAEPMQTYVVQRAKPRAFHTRTRGIEGIETRMIGRDNELQALQAAYETVINNQQMTVVTIVGTAGLGKSRLLYEFEQWLELRPELIHLFEGRAGQQTQGMPHYLLRDTLATRFRIRDGDPLPIVHQKFITGLAKFMNETEDELAMKTAILGSWLGYDFHYHPTWQHIQKDPEQIRNRAVLYLSQYLAAIQEPVVMLFEDLHWADASSLATIVTLLRQPITLPRLIICTARPSFYERHPNWDSAFPNHTRLDLTPLSNDANQTLVQEILQRINPLPPLLLELVLGRAEGNPFYAEEIIKMLIDNGAILTGDETWLVMPDKLMNLNIPPTLTGVLQARLDRLQPAERTTLQQASVIGRIFWDAALAKLEQSTMAVLPTLESKEFIFPRKESTFVGTMEYIFKHALLRDVTYESVLKQQRRLYHQRVAEWLAQAATVNGRADEYAGLIGEHYRLAQKEMLASKWYGRAGQHAVTNYAHEEAVHFLTRALDLTPETEITDRYDLFMAREKTYNLQGDRVAQQTSLAQLAELAQQLDAYKQAQIALRQANYARVTNNYVEAIVHAQAAIAIAEPEEIWEAMAGGYATWGDVLRYQGEYAPAQEVFHQGVVSAQMGNHKKQAAICLRGLGNVAWYLGEYVNACSYYEQALAIQQEIGNRLGMSANLYNLGTVAEYLGKYVTARSYYEQALAIRQEIGDQRTLGFSLNGLGSVARRLGEYTAARSYHEQALVIQQEIGDRWGEGLSLFNLGSVAEYLGEYATAQSYHEQALTIALGHGHLELEGFILNCLGMLALQQNQLEQALAHLQQALTIRQKQNQFHYLVENWAGLARVAFLQGDRSQAGVYLQQILTYLQEKPTLAGAEDRMRAFHMTWELLVVLEQVDEAQYVLTLAAQIMQDFLDTNRAPAVQETYLNQSHHQVLWAAWRGSR